MSEVLDRSSFIIGETEADAPVKAVAASNDRVATRAAKKAAREAKKQAASQEPQLYEAAKRIFPKTVRGDFRTLKWWLMGVMLGIYYITPWLRWERGAYSPDQAVLVDLANRRFYFFFIEIWPQEFFYVAGMLVMAGIGLFLITSILGRAWCGYACPQTVWVDLFLHVERLFEGDRNAQIRLDRAPWSINKITRRVGKHAVFVLIAMATGGAWVFYFADAPTLFNDLVTFQGTQAAYITIATLTATTYLLGGIARDQVCVYMCPWPRIQGAMTDENSLIVTYNDWRGEGRSLKRKKDIKAGKPVGDCVDCKACVHACPMGIDIRDGQQMECITCALCIDACDTVMKKLGLERGLISYSTLGVYNQNMAFAGAELVNVDGDMRWDATNIVPDNVRPGLQKLSDKLKHTTWGSIFRPRTFLYMGVYAAIGLTMLGVLATRDRLDIGLEKDRNPIFVKMSDGSIRNGYTLKIKNMEQEPRRFNVTVEGFDVVTTRVAGDNTAYGPTFFVDVDSSAVKTMHVFLRLQPGAIYAETMNFRFSISQVGGREREIKNAKFEGPPEAVHWKGQTP